MIVLYNICFLLFCIIYLPYLLIKRNFHKDFFQKFGILSSSVVLLKNPIWIHAVSVGEGAIAIKLSKALKKEFPFVSIIVSTTTQTGHDFVTKEQGKSIDATFYYPFDFSFIVKNVLKKIKPRLYIVIETELWPNLLTQLFFKKIPIMLVNGRLSDRSFSSYFKIRFVFDNILKKISCFCMQSEQDAQKILKLGADEKKVFNLGNIKFDEELIVEKNSMFDKSFFHFSEKNYVIVGGSTHSPEEQYLIDIYKKKININGSLRLILVPRHINRINSIVKYINNVGLEYVLFSNLLNKNNVLENNKKIILVDKIGYLKNIYSVADIVFVGGSLVKKGGQNPIEPALWGKAIIFGKYMYNFRQISDIFIKNNAAIMVKDNMDLELRINDLLLSSEKRDVLASNAQNVVKENNGALLKTLEKIKEYINI